MSDLSAFIAGLILGDRTPPKKKAKYYKEPTNIPLQDVLFCQTLSNILVGIDEFVRDSTPSQKEFAEFLVGKRHYEKPYTETEERQLQKDEQTITQYVRWANDTYGDDWFSTSYLEKIWNDPAHTPNPNHLDRIFAYDIDAPQKVDGVVYEYSKQLPLDGLAVKLFETPAAKIILQHCITTTSWMIGLKGYTFDPKRFYYRSESIFTPLRGSAMAIAYKSMLYDGRFVCRRPWSDMTRELFNVIDYEQAVLSQPNMPYNEHRKRNSEIKRIALTLTDAEISQYSEPIGVNHSIRQKRIGRVVDFIIFIPVGIGLLLFVVALILAAIGLDVANIIFILAASFVGVSLLMFLIGMSRAMLASKKKRRHDAVYDKIRMLQWHYYQKDGSPQAAEYAELLKRI